MRRRGIGAEPCHKRQQWESDVRVDGAAPGLVSKVPATGTNPSCGVGLPSNSVMEKASSLNNPIAPDLHAHYSRVRRVLALGHNRSRASVGSSRTSA